MINVHLDLCLANIHRLARDGCDLLADNQISNVLSLPGRGSPPKRIFALLLDTLIGLDKVAQHLRAGRSDDACVDVGTRTEIVEDTRRYSGRHQTQCFLSRHVGFPTALKDGHGCEASLSHRHIGQLVRRTVRMDRKELWTGSIYTPEDECGTDLSLVFEEMLLEHRHRCDDAWLAPR